LLFLLSLLPLLRCLRYRANGKFENFVLRAHIKIAQRCFFVLIIHHHAPATYCHIRVVLEAIQKPALPSICLLNYHNIFVIWS
jgi:uncharacterized membrane protein